MFNVFSKRIVPILIIAICKVLSAFAEEPSWIDSTEIQYTIAAREYDMDGLRKTAEFITRKPVQDQQSPRVLLLLGLTFWRQELIAYCLNTSADITRYGNAAIEKLSEAQMAGADIYLTASYKALAYQLIAAQGIRNGAIYGPRVAKELKKAQIARPQGYFSLLVEAINFNQAPSFAGGNPEKAVVLLEKLASTFPDSIDVTIHLSDAYIKTGRLGDARGLIMPVIKEFPSNLLARKIAAKLPLR